MIRPAQRQFGIDAGEPGDVDDGKEKIPQFFLEGRPIAGLQRILHFIGFLAVIYAHGRIHRMTTYTKARLSSLRVDENHVELVISDRARVLTVSATREKPGGLKAPVAGAMDRTISETVTSTISVDLVENGMPIFAGVGAAGGLEVAGDPKVLMPRS